MADEQKTEEQKTAEATAAADALVEAAAPKKQESPAPKEEPKAEPLAPNWAINRIDALTRQKRDLEERLEAARQKEKELPQRPRYDPRHLQKPQGPTQEEIDKRVEERVSQQRFAEECNKLYSLGTKEYDDFDQVLSTYKTIGGLQPTAVQAAIEIGDAHKILYNLARDPNEAYRVMNLPPAAQAAALAKVALSGVTTPGKASKAPPPVRAVADGKGAERTDSEKMSDPSLSMDEWVKIRRAQRAKKAEERQALRR
jgi:hypothetical protein